MLTDKIINSDFVGFKKAVEDNIKQKIAQHPQMQKHQEKMQNLANVTDLFKQISKS